MMVCRLLLFFMGSLTFWAIQVHTIPMAAIGVFILWLSWFDVNLGSTNSGDSSIAMIFVNTNLSAAAGVVAAMAY